MGKTNTQAKSLSKKKDVITSDSVTIEAKRIAKKHSITFDQALHALNTTSAARKTQSSIDMNNAQKEMTQSVMVALTGALKILVPGMGAPTTKRKSKGDHVMAH